jgi:hypothetical protein
MSNTPASIDITSINSTNDLVRLVEEVQKTKTPRALTKDTETVAVLVPASDVFTQLSENPQFIAEADTAR